MGRLAEVGSVQTPALLRAERIKVGAGAAIYLVWWALVELLLPGAFNPLLGRLLVVGLLVVVLGATYVAPWAARNVALLFTVCAWALTAHYAYLVRGNGGEPAWWGGLLITVAAVAACIHSQRALIAYSIFALGLAIAEALLGQLGRSVFPPGVLTVLVLSNMALRSRLRAEDERTMAAKLRLERDRAEEVSRFKTMFLGLVSHELLTPLQTLQLGVEALSRYPNAPASQRADREASIGQALVRLRELIESLLDYVQLEAGHLTVQSVELDIVSMISATVEELEPMAREKKLTLSLSCEGEAQVPPVVTDPKLFKLVLVNLLTNALKYTDAGSVEVTVSHGEAGHLVAVRDTGAGIAAENLARIFEPFTQLEPLEHKHAHGVGLGLAIVKQMSSKLGAQLEVSSTVGVGSTFTVLLPWRSASLDDTDPPARQSQARGADDARASVA